VGALFCAGASEEPRGREIYFRGTAAGKEITALLDGGQTRIVASMFPCAGCHGADGRGKTEGGIAAPDITWTALTKPYSVPRADGRSRPAYNESSLKRAIVMGLDSGAEPLHPVMPRFQLSYKDADDLVTFLKQLGHTTDPGISETAIRIGVLLPSPARLPGLHDRVYKSLTAYFRDINEAGGIYGRRVELKFHDLPASPSEGAADLRSWLQREPIFAVTGGFLAKEESTLAPVLKEAATPLICAFVLDPDVGDPLNQYIFYLDAGLRGEIEELERLADKLFPQGAHVAIADPNYEVTRKMSSYLKNRLEVAGWTVSTISPDASGCRDVGKSSQLQVIFWLSPQSPAAALRECSNVVGGETRFLLPGSFAGPELLALPDALDQRVFVTLPAGGPEKEDPSNDGTADAAKPWPDSASETPALASARLLTWALRNGGRDVSRQALLDTLESAYNLDLGFGFVVSYGPNRHVGGTAQRLYKVHSHHLQPVHVDSP
jgi:ABC-type branched-subunit amino acid transport system substrate-binding protein/mono/diheme cytochrome c family protein